MAETVKTGWLQDNNGDKFAPKTLSSQVITSDGIALEVKLDVDIANAESKMESTIDAKLNGKAAVQFITWEDDD